MIQAAPPLPSCAVTAEAATDGVSLPGLPDDARVRITAIAPSLPAAEAHELCTALAKLLRQFQREERCRAGVAAVIEGAALLIAWEGPPLSGCSHDKIAGVLRAHEAKTGAQLLSAPPLLLRVDLDAPVRALSRAEVRALHAAGRLTGDSMLLDTRVETFGAWRRAGCVPLAQSWLGPLLGPR